jgi:hypothetical protein
MAFWPHPALSKGEGSKSERANEREVKVLSFGEDLGEARSGEATHIDKKRLRTMFTQISI